MPSFDDDLLSLKLLILIMFFNVFSCFFLGHFNHKQVTASFSPIITNFPSKNSFVTYLCWSTRHQIISNSSGGTVRDFSRESRQFRRQFWPYLRTIFVTEGLGFDGSPTIIQIMANLSQCRDCCSVGDALWRFPPENEDHSRYSRRLQFILAVVCWIG